MKKVAILQSNYIPWKGYFDMIAAVDEFILYDDVQFTKNDWRNRNQIKPRRSAVADDTRGPRYWTTYPRRNHWYKVARKALEDIESNYRRARYFEEIAKWLMPLYFDEPASHLSHLNRRFIDAICNYLGIKTKLSSSWDYSLIEGKTERLVDLCAQVGGTEYISGPAARDYIEEGVFGEEGIELTWFDYSGYPEYPQLWEGFTHGVTILDLLFNCGKDAPRYMRYVR